MKRLFLLLVLSISAAAPAATFQGLGSNSIANDISADGTVVVGSGRWTQSTGWQDIGGTANACNADGSVVVGYREYNDFFGGILKKSIAWTVTEGMVDLPLHMGNNSEATDISSDGMTIVGYTRYSSNPISFYKEAFMYTLGADTTIGLGDLDVLPGEEDYQNINSAAYAVSGDGSVVAGSGIASGNVPKAMCWTQSTGMVGLGVLNEKDWYSNVTGISHNGSIMIGQSGNAFSFESHAIYWTQATGMQALGKLESYDYASCPLGLNEDMSTIVGWATDGYDDYAAFLWTESLGMVNLQEYLQDTYAFDLSGWTLTEATGISADGRTLTGNGINPDGLEEAWLVTIPEPASLLLLSLGIIGIRK